MNIRFGSLAFFAGILAALATAFALFLKKKEAVDKKEDPYDGWEDSLGV